MKRLIPAALSPILLLAFASPAFAGQAAADQSIDVKGKYTGNFGTMHTLVLGKGSSLSFGNGQTMTVSLTSEQDQGLRMVVTPVSQVSAESYAWVSGQTARTGSSPYAYHVAFYDGDTQVPLDGEAVIRLSVPSGYANAVFYYMDNSGSLSKVRTQKSGSTLSFTAQNSGYYLFLKSLSSSSDSDSGESSSSGASGGNSAPTGAIIIDSKKGYVHSENGILTGTTGSTASDGYSHWILDGKGWRLRYADGTYASGTGKDGEKRHIWEKVWYLFDSDGYAQFGWYLDTESGHWYYLDVNTGMKTGWHEDPQDGRKYYLYMDGIMATGWVRISGRWYFFNDYTPVATWEYSQTERIWKYRIGSDGRPYGSMYRDERTSDGYYVDADGVWDGRDAAQQ